MYMPAEASPGFVKSKDSLRQWMWGQFLKDQQEFLSGLVSFDVEDSSIPVEELGYITGTLGSGGPFRSTGKSKSGKFFNLPAKIMIGNSSTWALCPCVKVRVHLILKHAKIAYGSNT